MNDSSSRKPYLRFTLLIAVAFLLIGGISALCFPFFSRLSDPAVQLQLESRVASFGFGGWLLMLGLQMLQVIVAFIPGEPVELLMGVLYGTVGGLATCMLGTVLTSAVIFALVHHFGRPFVERIFGREKLNAFHFLNNPQKMETLTFLLFLLPGTPKDMLTYLVGISPMKLSQFLLISTFARIPSVLTSTMMGASFSRGRWGVAIATFLVTAALGLLGILYKNKLMAHLHRHHPDE